MTSVLLLGLLLISCAFDCLPFLLRDVFMRGLWISSIEIVIYSYSWLI